MTGKHNMKFNKVFEEDAAVSTDGSIPFSEIATAVVKKRDHIARQAGVEPEEVTLGAYKLVFVIGKPITYTKGISAAMIVQACSIGQGCEYLTPLVDSDD
jgi:hypothetical protein